MATNDILTYCPTDTGTNLLTEAEYLADADRVSGNKPGVARSKLVNKALRQSAFIASQLAQYIANQTGNNVLDDNDTATLLANMTAALNASSQAQLNNLTIAPSVAGGALTIAVKTRSNVNATASFPILVGMRSATLASGLYLQRTISAALSMVISSGSTLGQVSAQPSKIFVYLIDNAGTLELAVSHSYYSEDQLVTTVAEGGGTATSASAIYSAAVRTGVPIRLIGTLTNTQATAGTWATVPSQVQLLPSQNKKAPTVQTFLTGSGTYITPAGVLYIRVRAVGAGGGGCGGTGSTGSGAAGGPGADTSFGTSLIVAGFGSGGAAAGGAAGAGGAASLGTGPVGLALVGGGGSQGSNYVASVSAGLGGIGGSSAFGGGGRVANGVGGQGAPNTGGGAAGGASYIAASGTSRGGAGGGSGGFVDAIIYNPLASYAYAVGAGGTAGAAGSGTGSFAGGTGGDGLIIVEEYYQ